MKTPQDCLWIKEADFAETTLTASVVNTTTTIKVADSPLVEIAGFESKGMILRLPNRSCSTGHFLDITLMYGAKKQDNKKQKAKNPQNGNTINLTGKVTAVEKFDVDSSLFSVLFFQIDEVKWKRFQGLMAQRQAKADHDVKRIKE